jgi:SpoVK/Ycf46/Vps4 family AAA+-type ATPase
MLFELNTKNLKMDPSVNFELLAKKTKRYSGADIVILIRSASFLPLRRYFKKKG